MALETFWRDREFRGLYRENPMKSWAACGLAEKQSLVRPSKHWPPADRTLWIPALHKALSASDWQEQMSALVKCGMSAAGRNEEFIRALEKTFEKVGIRERLFTALAELVAETDLPPPGPEQPLWQFCAAARQRHWALSA